MANLDEGAVLGGRYQITGRVMASSQGDQVLNGLDQVLNREVLILVASRENASQAAQSARQLATGERASSIQILDLGLSNDRTYLVAPGNSDVEALLALLTNQEVYVEPFFTEALGTELFGESRSNTPQTFDDDAEYYADLQDELEEEQDEGSNRPEFLNKLSDRIDNWLQDENNEAPIAPGRPHDSSGKSGIGTAAGLGAAAGAGAAAAGASKNSDDDDTDGPKTEQTEQQEPARSKLPILDDDQDDDEVEERVQPGQPQQPTPPQEPVDSEPEEEAPEERTQIVPPVTQEPITQSQPQAAAAQEPAPDQPAEERSKQRAAAPIIPPPAPDEPTAEEGYAIQYTDERQRSTLGRWLAGLLLVAVLVGAVIVGFQFLGSPEQEEEPPVAEEPTEEQPADGQTDEPDEEESEDLPDPVPASVERVVPDAPQLSNEYESDLPAIVDGNQATAWHTLTFTSPQFGGFASNLALVVELEEKAPISEITIAQNQGSGGAFTVAVSNEPDPTGGVMLTDGSFTGPEYTVDAHNEDGEPIEARYVIINFTELPTLSNTNSPERPYGLRIAEIDVN
ncbi:discoidin domain-containing protein [Yaniella halotolerans]|uniref:discoidin domain-containing protein n=1 Tax=Yaniella halotolerans TaxID=225453 RepID=UPI0003B32702|nr:discoidin domain-containing protein [Yaniella halotolerans]